MASRMVTRVVRAAGVAVIVELTDRALDRAGLTADKYRIARRLIKACTATVGGVLIAKVLGDFDGEREGVS